jgi:Protein of Unknown function (DUF2784)
VNGYVLLADVVAVFHCAYIAFVVGGFALIVAGAVERWQWIRGFWFRVAHFAAIVFVCAEEVTGRVCPLTKLESRLRMAGGGVEYSRDFVGYWVDRLIFWDYSPRFFSLVYFVFGLLIAVAFVLAPPKLPRWKRRAGLHSADSGALR